MNLYEASLAQMTETEEEQPIELTREQYLEAKVHYVDIIERGEAARRLSDNQDFTNLVMIGYLDNEPKRLADLLSSGRINAPQTQDAIQAQILAVGHFRNYLKMHIEQANQASDELASLEEAYNEAVEQAANS